MDSIHVQALRRSMSIKGFPKRLKTGNTPMVPPPCGVGNGGVVVVVVVVVVEVVVVVVIW